MPRNHSEPHSPSGLHIYTSNRLEILSRTLADILRAPFPDSPFEQEIIVVQSSGMERWVSLELAKHLGVCANCRFPFPNSFFDDIFRKILPGVERSSSYDPLALTWRLMERLPSRIDNPGFEDLKNYLSGDSDHLKLFQLSEKIADIYDQYLLFRADDIFKWEGGAEKHWQAALWRSLREEDTGMHRADLSRAVLKRARSTPLVENLPSRIFVFGISYLPPLYIALLAAISGLVDVSLFVMNPCREYWGDIVPDRVIQKRRGVPGGTESPAEGLYLETGNRLLASMGTQGRWFFDFLSGLQAHEHPVFHEPKRETLLGSIQADILDLKETPLPRSKNHGTSTGDNSILIHSCHSPMREMEVLRDRLLDMLEKDPTLSPGDILVMTPDIEIYAPYIHAVFEKGPENAPYIPFSVADQSIRKEGNLIETFLSFLDIPESRFKTSEVIALLESPPVSRRFDIESEDLDLVRSWVNETRIRWGIDQYSRSELGLPPMKENTWRAGLERLLLGYALPYKDDNVFGGILPYGEIEGSSSLVLGRFIEFMERLFNAKRNMSRPRSPASWSETLTEMLEEFFMPELDEESEIRILRDTLRELKASASEADFSNDVDIRVIKWYLTRSMGKKGFGFGFLTGAATFCATLPMRSIPFKIICMVGMNSESFPRQSRPLGFDLISKNPRPGDKSLRNDDKYLFLEAILSARQHLHISYIGQDINDNSLLPPSVLVSEFMDYLEQMSAVEADALENIFIKHRLQPFNPDYFRENDRLFSYSREAGEAARGLFKKRNQPAPFFSEGLEIPGEDWKTVDIEKLCAFFSNPASFLLRQRLGLFLFPDEPELEETEPFEVKPLDRYKLRRDLLASIFSKGDTEKIGYSARAAGLLPHGTPGRCAFESLVKEAREFAEKTLAYLSGPLDPLEFDLQVSGYRITGRISDIYAGSLTKYRLAKIRRIDLLRVWLYHLALNCSAPGDYPKTSMLIGLYGSSRKNETWTALHYKPLDNAINLLEAMLSLYWRGLQRPLLFFPETSWTYAQEVLKREKSAEQAVQKAQKVWTGNDFKPGEGENGYFNLCFKNQDPLGPEFCGIAEEVFGPMMSALDRV